MFVIYACMLYVIYVIYFCLCVYTNTVYSYIICAHVGPISSSASNVSQFCPLFPSFKYPSFPVLSPLCLSTINDKQHPSNMPKEELQHREMMLEERTMC